MKTQHRSLKLACVVAKGTSRVLGRFIIVKFRTTKFKENYMKCCFYFRLMLSQAMVCKKEINVMWRLILTWRAQIRNFSLSVQLDISLVSVVNA